jgi:ribose transport system ATP-binding protein
MVRKINRQASDVNQTEASGKKYKPSENLCVDMHAISKEFPGVRALDNVDLQVKAGEIMGLVGENGAGKSTLMKILSGAYTKDSGVIFVNGKEVSLKTPIDALRIGIHVIYQEPDLVPVLTVKENVYLGHSITRLGLLAMKDMLLKTRKILDDLGFDIDPDTNLENLSVAQQQIVAIAKALSGHVQVLVLDEPAAVLPDNDLLKLFSVMRRLRDQGVSIIYISHRLQEVLEITNRVTVLKDGKQVGVIETAQANEDLLTKMMVGRNFEHYFPEHETQPGDETFRAENITTHDVHKINLTLHTSEILGIYGLVGSGRTELAHALFGLVPIESGHIYINNKATKIYGPRDAITKGIGFLTEDRKHEGLVLSMPVCVNTTMASYGKISSLGWINLSKEMEITQEYVNILRIKTPDLRTTVGILSGGNQQKVVLSKWLCTEVKVLIFDEPTRGIDVGAKAEIYQLMNNLIKHGISIIMISSELPEVIAMCDRVLVMRNGGIVGEVARKKATEQLLCSMALGGSIN